MQAQPMTLMARSGELQVLRTFASARPAIPIGMVARTIHSTNWNERSRKLPRMAAEIELTAKPLTSVQK